MRTIFKYPINITGEQSHKTSIERILHVGLDPTGQPCIWAEVDTESPAFEGTFYIIGTGKPIPEEATKHIGSFVQGPFVWHVYV